VNRRLVFRVLGVLVASGLFACGPIQFISQVTIRAEKAVATAKLHKAHIYAKYEYYGAEAFLEQAKHRAGFGDFQTAYRYGVRSEKLANKAVKLTNLRREEERDVGDKSEGARPAPPRR
jgi:hypothetical protein